MAKALNWKLLHNQYEEVQDYKDKVIFFHTKYLGMYRDVFYSV